MRALCACATLVALTFATNARAEDGILLVVRTSFGFALHFRDGHVKPAFKFEVDGGMAYEWGFPRSEFATYVDSNVVLIPEMGYTFDSLGTHAFNLGVGVGGGNRTVDVTYDPRLILGDHDGHFVVGMRNAAALRILRDIVDFEMGHQFTVFGGETDQEFVALAGFNLPTLVLYLLPF